MGLNKNLTIKFSILSHFIKSKNLLTTMEIFLIKFLRSLKHLKILVKLTKNKRDTKILNNVNGDYIWKF